MDFANKLLQEAFEHHKAGRLDMAEPAYNMLLNRSLDNPQLLYLLGDLYCRRGYNGLACTLFHAALSVDATIQEVWIDLGVALKKEHYNDAAKTAWLRALELGENAEVFTNLATLYADSGEPEKALEWLDKALAMEPDKWEAHWNKALALLALHRWEEGWKHYENRCNLPSIPGRPRVQVPQWDGRTAGKVYIHGEQGVGDEIMFLSCLPDVMALGVRPVVEVNPKLVSLVRSTWPDLDVFSTEQEFLDSGIKVDAKVSLASLPRLFRRRDSDFPGTPYLKPDPALVEKYRQVLRSLGEGPYIAVSWIGGVKETRVHERSIPLEQWLPITTQWTSVCAQYGPVDEQEMKLGNVHFIDDACRGGDLGAQAALFAACDAVVTVVQTSVHLAGALGVPAYVMVPSRPSWRYGVEGDMPWYKSVRLFRQAAGEDWGFVIPRVASAIKHDFGQVQRAKSAVA